MQLRRVDKSLVSDFFALHSEANGCGWCYCVAWWVPTWDGWSERTAVQNRELRERLFDEGQFDGYLYYDESTPVAWCQVGPRDRLAKLLEQFGLEPDPEVWAITCFVVAPSYRELGVARAMLKDIIQDLRSRGVSRVQAYPKRTRSYDPVEHWRGPERLYEKLGFQAVSGSEAPLVLELELREGQ